MGERESEAKESCDLAASKPDTCSFTGWKQEVELSYYLKELEKIVNMSCIPYLISKLYPTTLKKNVLLPMISPPVVFSPLTELSKRSFRRYVCAQMLNLERNRLFTSVSCKTIGASVFPNSLGNSKGRSVRAVHVTSLVAVFLKLK